MKVGVLAKLKIQPDMNEAFEKAFLSYQQTVIDSESGNIFFGLHRSREDACTYTVMEQYDGQAALNIHQSADYYKNIPETFGQYMAGPPDIEFLDGVS
ncbi:MAG: antibiotic biosynthesis monooxygenase [Gammaproteobacteria bacterium]|jgi:quinol monooxygenase YgiN|nr:antibiotic biosynthesis monooxygenase [Gammaproteobacteria bacterium]